MAPRVRYGIAVLSVLALVAAGCASEGSVGGDIPPPTEKTSEQTVAQPIDAASPSGIVGGDSDFSYSALVWQGYWLSRDQLGPYTMGSGLGIPFEPSMEMMQQAAGMVAQNPDDAVMMPVNASPLAAVYASSSSDLVNDPRELDAGDLEAWRLDPTTFDETVLVRAQAETMLKESQWARSFADSHFGEVTSDFGAQQRFLGVMMNMMAMMQGQYAMEHLVGADGLYVNSDGTMDFTGNWVMLHALSDIAGLLAGDAGPQYQNPDAAPAFDGAATMLFKTLENRTPESAAEAASAIRALVYRASTTTDVTVADEALAAANRIADDVLVPGSFGDPVTRGAAIAGLISWATAGGGDEHLQAADALFAALQEDFDADHGVFVSRDVYTVDDVAWILGGLNGLVQQGSAEVRAPAAAMLLAFYESTISVGGLQLAAPPGKNGAGAGEWEKNLPAINFYHPIDTPPPPAVGKLPTAAEEITWDGSSWSVTSDRFVVAGVMHLANELNWFGPHLGSQPFPSVG